MYNELSTRERCYDLEAAWEVIGMSRSGTNDFNEFFWHQYVPPAEYAPFTGGLTSLLLVGLDTVSSCISYNYTEREKKTVNAKP